MTPTSQDRHAAVNAFANRVAKYVTEEGDPEWSPYRCAVEAVTVAMQDAWYEVEAIGSPAAAPTPPEATQVHRIERGDDRWDEVTGGRTDIEFWCQYEMHPVAASPTVLVELSDEELGRIAFEAFFADPYATSWPRAARAVRDALAVKEADR
jgi:hypothetical protein